MDGIVSSPKGAALKVLVQFDNMVTSSYFRLAQTLEQQYVARYEGAVFRTKFWTCTRRHDCQHCLKKESNQKRCRCTAVEESAEMPEILEKLVSVPSTIWRCKHVGHWSCKDGVECCGVGPTQRTNIKEGIAKRRRVHERARHPSQFHAGEAVALKVERQRARWDPEEIAMMADYEAANLRASNINLKIQQDVLPYRTIEGIEGARQSEPYKAWVRSAAGPSSPPSALDLRGPATSPPIPPTGRSIDHPDVTPMGPVSGSPQPPPLHVEKQK
ncbi:hypothetical protein E2C01_010644 [Portunus trituberculatus]|uniref:Uncharacterized protein n=1 Tax=Portunus trituberculatus TaxID=210409 RepID=A0A5B7D900_PORTR|nr:hypothetical protein [Portunus trituberculatus]